MRRETVTLDDTFHSQEWSISSFSCSLTRNITSHRMVNLAFHDLLRLKMSSLIHFSLRRLGECPKETAKDPSKFAVQLSKTLLVQHPAWWSFNMIWHIGSTMLCLMVGLPWVVRKLGWQNKDTFVSGRTLFAQCAFSAAFTCNLAVQPEIGFQKHATCLARHARKLCNNRGRNAAATQRPRSAWARRFERTHHEWGMPSL